MGLTLVQYTATDAESNSSTCSFAVTVSGDAVGTDDAKLNFSVAKHDSGHVVGDQCARDVIF